MSFGALYVKLNRSDADAINVSLPLVDRPASDPDLQPWPHVDQSPLRTYLKCVQGIVNLLPNGPDDGGLMVLEGSNAVYSELWDRFDHKKPKEGWTTVDRQDVDQEMLAWMIEKGCKWVKVCAEPGDLLLWDSVSRHSERRAWLIGSGRYITALSQRLRTTASQSVSPSSPRRLPLTRRRLLQTRPRSNGSGQERTSRRLVQ